MDNLPPFLPKRDWRPSAEREPVAELRRENEKLRTALNDAINSPKGVVPNSAGQFYDGRVGRIQ